MATSTLEMPYQLRLTLRNSVEREFSSEGEQVSESVATAVDDQAQALWDVVRQNQLSEGRLGLSISNVKKSGAEGQYGLIITPQFAERVSKERQRPQSVFDSTGYAPALRLSSIKVDVTSNGGTYTAAIDTDTH